MTDVAILIDSARAMGFSLRLVDGKVRITGPQHPDAQALIAELRVHRDEIAAMLRDPVSEFFASLGIKPVDPEELAKESPSLAAWMMRKPKTTRYMTPAERAALDEEITESVAWARRELARLKSPVAKEEGMIRAYSINEWKKLSKAEREEIIQRGFDSRERSINKQEGDSIGWARWSENLVTGCLHDCPYCYARDIAERLFPYKFAPMFHPNRLAAPKNVKVPEEAKLDTAFKNIFANSMSDLFGKWVPEDWIEATIKMARRNPQWNFLTLTKFPIRAAEFEFPDNWWMGTTVDVQARLDNAERAFEKIRCKTKWLSCEPLLTPLKFKRLDLFQWVVIGGSSRSTKTPEWIPPFDWIADLHRQARDAGCRIYHKTNLGLTDEMRLREFPWVKPVEKKLPKEFQYLKGMCEEATVDGDREVVRREMDDGIF